MPDEDPWLAVREDWARNVSLLHGQVQPRHTEFVIKRRLNYFVRPDVAIAMTGMRGAGKTTLVKALRKQLRLGEYLERGESEDYEYDRFVAHTVHGKRQVGIVTVPGQKDSVQGQQTRRKFFERGNRPSGVVHSVSWGYSKIWDADLERVAIEATPLALPARLASVADTEIEKVRAHNLRGELDDFRQTRRLLQECWRPPNDTPLWLVIVVGKPDLFRDPEQLDRVRDYYIPGANPGLEGDFARELRGLVNNLGWYRFRRDDSTAPRIAVLPVISYLEDYAAGGATVASVGNPDLMAVLMTNFSNRIGEFSDERV